jgi:hypothetical protein
MPGGVAMPRKPGSGSKRIQDGEALRTGSERRPGVNLRLSRRGPPTPQRAEFADCENGTPRDHALLVRDSRSGITGSLPSTLASSIT